MCAMSVPGHGTRSIFRGKPAVLQGALVDGKAMVLRTAHGSDQSLTLLSKLASCYWLAIGARLMCFRHLGSATGTL